MSTEYDTSERLEGYHLSESDSESSTNDEQEQPERVKNSQALKDAEDILTRYEEKIEPENIKLDKTSKDRANRATVEQVLDPRTMKFLKKLISRGVIYSINGCISTGKEANVYHADGEDTQLNGERQELAVKIYKTSILVFKDRERYVDGEFRFRNTKNQRNPRKMVTLWAEKEFRNLKRLYTHGVSCPKPVDLKSHILIMEFLTTGTGQAAPKLKDYSFDSTDEVVSIYYQMLLSMRRMFQVCRLVHADLSEYNTIVLNKELYIFDVSQSVEPSHPMALDFLRMDIKNINDFFSKKKINVYPERIIFKFITAPASELGIENTSEEALVSVLDDLPLKGEDDDESNTDDAVFRSVHLLRSLKQLDEDDFGKFEQGNYATAQELVKSDTEDNEETSASSDYDSCSEDSKDEEDGEDSISDELQAPLDRAENKKPEEKLRGKKFEDKDYKKSRKEATKIEKQEKRKTKMKKHVKKKLINKRRR